MMKEYVCACALLTWHGHTTYSNPNSHGMDRAWIGCGGMDWIGCGGMDGMFAGTAHETTEQHGWALPVMREHGQAPHLIAAW
mmetsp:Transcript_7998/g.13765  ORF Transcript_7998/g.13765 Transcript_7998/m.13765 type:complete len:82 (-) Transcript_7998:27-272(-)